MRITNEFKTRRIDFIKIESVKEHYPTHKIQIEIETENIRTNFNNSIWLSDTDIEKFLVDLDSLDKNRKGQATLGSMSPREMQLTFKSIDSLGHLSVILHFVKEDRVNKNYSFDIKVDFQVDPTSLANVRAEMLELIK